jgi:hypothetical protein
MTLCPCKNLGTVAKVTDHQSFFKSLNEIEIGNWVRLMECNSCSQLWAVKEWDKYQIQLATKIPLANRTTWQEANTEGEKEFLIKSRGGLTSEICAWARCGKPCVVGVAYCVDHLYETGTRE